MNYTINSPQISKVSILSDNLFIRLIDVTAGIVYINQTNTYSEYIIRQDNIIIQEFYDRKIITAES